MGNRKVRMGIDVGGTIQSVAIDNATQKIIGKSYSKNNS